MKLFFILMLVVSSVSCAPSVKFNSFGPAAAPGLSNNVIVKVFENGEELPAETITLGELLIGDSGMTMSCGYDRMRRKAQEEARKAGGNAIQIISVMNPDVQSSCYRFKVKVLLVPAQ